MPQNSGVGRLMTMTQNDFISQFISLFEDNFMKIIGMFALFVFVILIYSGLEIVKIIRFLMDVYPIYLKNIRENEKQRERQALNREKWGQVNNFFEHDTGYNKKSIMNYRLLKPCFKELGFKEIPKDEDEIKRQYRSLAKKYHPDSPNGDTEKFMKLKIAYEEARKEWKYQNQ